MTERKKQQDSRKFTELQALLKQEITLSQEILSQMSQQEYLMLIGELEMYHQLQKEVKALVKQLNILQKKRKILIQELLESAPLQYTLADLLDSTDETHVETLLFLEKYKVLLKKIAAQEKRNRSLHEMIQKEGTLTDSNVTLHSHIIYDSRNRKPLLITIDYPEEQAP